MMSSRELDTRERILSETRRLMIEARGVDVRLQDIAKAAGVSRQALYLHFGSRAGLLIATARYLDETARHIERSQPVREAPNGESALAALIDFWASYIPDIYGLAKALITVRESDEDAASAWDDRMAAFYGKCLFVITLLADEGRLSPEWASADEAADFLWTLLAISNWEHLRLEKGWTQDQYRAHLHRIAHQSFVHKL